MGLLDIFTGPQGGSGRVPPLAKALAGFLPSGRLHPGHGADRADLAAKVRADFFKPSPGCGPTAKGLMGALLTGRLMDLVQQSRSAGKGDAAEFLDRSRPQSNRQPERFVRGADG